MNVDCNLELLLVSQNQKCYTNFMQIWSIGMTLASQAGKAGSIPVICLFEISLKVRESQYLSAFPHFSLFPNQKHFCLKMQHALQVQFLNQSILQYL